MKIEYFCNGWAAEVCKPFVRWTKNKAKQAHENKQAHGVLVRHPHPWGDLVAVDFRYGRGTDRFIDIFFHDENKFCRSAFVFFPGKGDNDELFLRSVGYLQPTDKPKTYTDAAWRLRHRFSTDRSASSTYSCPGLMTGFNARHTWKTDVSSHWAEFPDFGDYESISSFDRGQLWSIDNSEEVLEHAEKKYIRDYAKKFMK